MKKIVLIFILTIVAVIIFSDSENVYSFYVKTFNNDSMIESNEIDIKIFGYLKKYFETGYSGYLKAANELRIKFDDDLSIEEKQIFDLMALLNPQTTIEPIKKFQELKNKYPNSNLIKVLLIEFQYKQWLITGDPKLVKEILDKIENSINIMGNTPFFLYYKSNILFRSKIYGNKKESYNLIKKAAIEFPENKKIIETYLLISTQLNKDKEDKDLFEKVSKYYIREPETKDNILLLIAKHFFENNNEDLAKDIVLNKIISQTQNTKILFLSYELLGDYADTNIQRMEYYKKSLSYNSENARVLSKWALVMLKVDKNKYKTLARIALNKAITINPNISEEAKNALKKLRNEIKIEVMINYLLPIILLVVGSISFLIYYEKRKEKKEKIKMFEENDNEGEKND